MYAFLSIVALLIAWQSSDFERGVALIEKGQPNDAIAPLLRATENRPEDARIWKALGVAYAAMGQYDGAEPAFARACLLAPKLLDACYYHARALYALNRFEPSLAALEKADAKQWKVLLARAQALEALNRPEQAEDAFRAAVAGCREQDPEPGVGLGLFLVRQGRIDDALMTIGDTVKRFPRSAEAQLQLGRALMDNGRVGEATGHLEIAVQLAPQSSQGHLLLAKAYVRLNRKAEAQTHFDAAARGVR